MAYSSAPCIRKNSMFQRIMIKYIFADTHLMCCSHWPICRPQIRPTKILSTDLRLTLFMSDYGSVIMADLSADTKISGDKLDRQKCLSAEIKMSAENEKTHEESCNSYGRFVGPICQPTNRTDKV